MIDTNRLKDLCYRYLRGDATPMETNDLVSILGSLNIKYGEPIKNVPCPRCGKVLIRSRFWGVACLVTGDQKGCGLRP